MHRGVQEFVAWLTSHGESDEVDLAPPAGSRELADVEQELGVPLPADLRWVLSRFNGGRIPTATLFPAGRDEGSVLSATRWLAEQLGVAMRDPELPLAFGRADEGSVLAFDRSGGPMPDTWPVIDYYEQTGETRLVARTFDGWCRFCVAEWKSPDYGASQSLDTYLRQGHRRVQLEPDVSVAHAQLAHALRRAGRPEEALASYLRAAECIPPLAWCDWEALKLAAVLGRPREAFAAAVRLSARGPERRWHARETSPGRVAEVLGALAPRVRDGRPWLALVEQLAEQVTDPEDQALVLRVRQGFAADPRPTRPIPKPSSAPPPPPPHQDLDVWWQELESRYVEGELREEELLTDPTLEPVRRSRDVADLLRLRREL